MPYIINENVQIGNKDKEQETIKEKIEKKVNSNESKITKNEKIQKEIKEQETLKEKLVKEVNVEIEFLSKTNKKFEKEVKEQKKEENNKLINLYPPIPAIQVDKDTNYPKDNKYNNKPNMIEENNYIISKYECSGLIQILNCYDLVSQNNSNFKGESNISEIKTNCDIYLNNEKIPFAFKCNFKKEGKNEIKIIFKKDITITNYLFYNCSLIKSLDLSNFKTDNVTNMSYMFYNCTSLKELDLSNLNTNNVTNMSYMFNGCTSISNLDLSNLKTDNVTNMSYMFRECSSLIKLNLSNFKTEKVTDMSYMFYNCLSLLFLDLENFTLEKISQYQLIFSGLQKQCDIYTKDKNFLKIIKFNR